MQPATSGVISYQNLLYVPCSISQLPLHFLVDTGSIITVIPRKYAKYITPTTQILTAANGSNIRTYGTSTLQIAIPQLRRSFQWNCFVADVTVPLLGADFLKHYKLLVDMTDKHLVDKETGFHIKCKPCLNKEILSLYPIFAIDTKLPKSISTLLTKYKSLTSDFTAIEPVKHNTKHHINTNGLPVHSRVRPLYGSKLEATKREFEKLEQLGVVRKSYSPWASPIHLVPKGTGWRVCGDYRRLNSITEKDSYPMPNANALYTVLHGNKIFTTLDLVRGYNQIPMEESSIEKTAVITPVGLYEYVRMPFGLCNAAQSFQRFMDGLLGHLPYVFVYIDDVLIFSKTEQEHLLHIEEVLSILHEANLRIGIEKCNFMKDTINYLGFTVTPEGMIPNKKKCEAISEMKPPQTYHELHRFLGSIGFYRKHIHHFAHKAYSLYQLLRQAPSKHAPLDLDDNQMLAFESLKLELQKLTQHSFIDPNSRTFTITSDASQVAIGATLHQVINGESKLIQFYSRKLSDTETRYSTFDRELLAAHDAVQFFLPYVEGSDLTLFTDHKPLTFAINKKADCKSDRQARHLSFLSEHLSQLLFIKGEDNIVADYLSRVNQVNALTLDPFDLDAIAEKQHTDEETQKLAQDRKDTISAYKFKQTTILCELSNQYPRPLVPKELRYKAFLHLHSMGHPGKKGSTRLMRQRYYWPSMGKDINEWCKQCQSCQQQKIIRHTKSPLKELPDPSGRFTTVHMDIVGPLPIVTDQSGSTSKYRYIVTFIDRFTRWIEACPLENISTEEVANALVNTWIARFGVPLELITDRGSQFESKLFHHLAQTMGFIRMRTTAYHPQGNGLIERQHRTLKSILRSHKQDWLSTLPVALLAMRITPNSTGHSPFALVTGASVHIPATSFTQQKIDMASFVRNLAGRMELLTFSPTQWHTKKSNSYVPTELQTCPSVWVRVDRVRRPMEAPYLGPFEVIDRNDKYFIIRYPSGRTDTVAINRLKPHYATNTLHENNSTKHKSTVARSQFVQEEPLEDNELDEMILDQQVDSDTEEQEGQQDNLPDHIKFDRKIPFKTRSGRTIRFTNTNRVYTYIRPDYEFEI